MPTLYVVGTPIGNLQDMTPRAIDTLRRVALIAAEDTRVTKKLLTVFDIDTPLTACHQHNEDTKGAYLADKMLSDNIDIALTTDAGTPCISDPGYALVKACVDRGIEVLAIPGCCASICARNSFKWRAKCRLRRCMSRRSASSSWSKWFAIRCRAAASARPVT